MIAVSLACLFEILSVVVCLHYLYGEKFCFDKVTICLIIVDVIWMSIVDFFHLDQIWSSLMYPFVIIYCCLRFGINKKAILVNNVLYMIILSMIQTTTIILFYALLKVKRPDSVHNVFINILMLIIVVLGLRKCNLKKISDILQGKERLIRYSVVIGFISVIIFLLTYKQDNGFNELYYIVLGISVLLIGIVAIDIGKHKIREKEAQAELHLHKLYEASFRELIDEISARQHEFDNHLNTIYSQHRLYKTYDELVEAQRKYCDAIMEENRFNKILSKGNPVILCFLYSKFSELSRQGIIVTYHISIENLNCKMPIHKMVELLGNLIKNAEEAVRGEERKVHVLLVEELDIIRIEVSNESNIIEEKKIKEFFKKGYSDKGKRRGYGLYNVKKICEEYEVALVCRNEQVENNNWLVFRLIINKPL